MRPPGSAGPEREGVEHWEQVQIIHSLGSEKGQLSQGPGQMAKVVINRT